MCHPSWARARTEAQHQSENIGSADVELTPDDLHHIDDAATKIAVQGARYPEQLERMTNL